MNKFVRVNKDKIEKGESSGFADRRRVVTLSARRIRIPPYTKIIIPLNPPFTKGELKVIPLNLPFIRGELKIVTLNFAFTKGGLKIIFQNSRFIKGGLRFPLF